MALDYRHVADALLLKMALEGKDFQKARREVASSQATPPDAPPSPNSEMEAPAPRPNPAMEAFALSIEIDRLSIQVQRDAQSGTTTASMSITHAHLDVAATRQAVASPKKDPLVLDLAGSGPTTTGAEGAKTFDLAGDGTEAPTSFATGRTAFLALDRNSNGRIDSGLELFGDQHGAADGYAELAKFDANGDERIDAADPVFSRLQLLFGDGTLTGLASEDIQSLSLAATNQGGLTSGGDDILLQATASLANGASIQTYALGLNRFDATA
jgi:hypothetical protein